MTHAWCCVLVRSPAAREPATFPVVKRARVQRLIKGILLLPTCGPEWQGGADVALIWEVTGGRPVEPTQRTV